MVASDCRAISHPERKRGDYHGICDSTSQALDWFKQQSMTPAYGLLEYYKREDEKMKAGKAF